MATRRPDRPRPAERRHEPPARPPDRPRSTSAAAATTSPTAALVMGILNRTPDSFYDKGATFALDALYARAEQLVADGRRHPRRRRREGRARARGHRGRGARPGGARSSPAWWPRFDTPVSVDTWRASVARASYAEGAVMGNDISGFADPDYAPAAAEHGAAVVVTHIRLAPRVADPEPHYDDVVRRRGRLPHRAGGAGACRRHPAPSASCSTPASTSARRPSSRSPCCAPRRPWPASATRCCSRPPTRRSSARSSTWSSTERREASLGAAALGIAWGCRILRVHDVQGTCRVRDALAAVERGARDQGGAASTYLVKGDDASLVAQEVRAPAGRGGGRPRPRPRRRGDRRRRRSTSSTSVPSSTPASPRPSWSTGAWWWCATPAGCSPRDVPRLVEVVQDPLPTTVLVLVGGGGTVPAPLVKAVNGRRAQVIDVTTGKAGDRKAWLHDHLRGAPVQARAGGRRPAGRPRRRGPGPGRGPARPR